MNELAATLMNIAETGIPKLFLFNFGIHEVAMKVPIVECYSDFMLLGVVRCFDIICNQKIGREQFL